mgnify:CR=1 FL=1
MGFTGASYNNLSPYNSLGTATEPLSGYLYVQGGTAANSGNLAIGTINANSEIKFFAGGINDANVAVKIKTLMEQSGKWMPDSSSENKVKIKNKQRSQEVLIYLED